MTQTHFLPSLLMAALLLVAVSCAESRGWKKDGAEAGVAPRNYSCDDIRLVLHSEEIVTATSKDNGSAGDDTEFMPHARAETPGNDGAANIKSFIDLNDAMGLDAVSSAILLRMLKIF